MVYRTLQGVSAKSFFFHQSKSLSARKDFLKRTFFINFRRPAEKTFYLKPFISKGFQQSTRPSAEKSFSAPGRINSRQDSSFLTRIRLQRGSKTPKNPARFARRNVDFTRDFKLFAPKGGPKTPKNRRASRAETLFFLGISSFLRQKGVPNRKKNRRASRAETLIS